MELLSEVISKTIKTRRATAQFININIEEQKNSGFKVIQKQKQPAK